MDEQIRTALLRAIDQLHDAERSYTVAVREAARAEILHRDAQEALQHTITFHTHERYNLGLSGNNSEIRANQMAVYLDNNPYVIESRKAAAKAHENRELAQAEARVWDVRQKVGRAEVAALTALAGSAA